jgi:hypothetical protein
METKQSLLFVFDRFQFDKINCCFTKLLQKQRNCNDAPMHWGIFIKASILINYIQFIQQ